MTVLDRRPAALPPTRVPRTKLVKVLLGCGVAFPVTYAVANDVIAASRYDGYSRMDQAVSELSAIGAPTRPFLRAMLPVFTGLSLAYGVGVWNSAQGRRAVRATGAIQIASGLTGIAWLPFPMTAREDLVKGAGGATDVGHVVLSGLTVAEILALLGTGSAAFGRRFRVYSLLSAAVVLASGALMAIPAARLSEGKPTTRMGLYERVTIGTWLLWLSALAGILLRERDELVNGTGQTAAATAAASPARRAFRLWLRQAAGASVRP